MSRPEGDFVTAYEEGIDRLVEVIEAAVGSGRPEWGARLSAGLGSGLELLASDPSLARLLLVEALTVGGEARLAHERSLAQLAEALRPPAEVANGELVSDEFLRLQAGGLVSYLSGRVLAGEAEQLPQDHDLLLRYLRRIVAA